MGVIYKNGIPYGGGSGSGSSQVEDRVIVSLTAPTATDVYELLGSYPTGYTMNNCYIEAAYAVVDGYKYTLNNGTATVCLGSDGIYGIVASTAYLSGTFTAILRLVPQS